MLIFFINGALNVTKGDLGNIQYIMRFLTETTEEVPIKITMYDEFNNTIEHIEQVNGLTCIKVDCTDFLDKFNWQNIKYLRIKYTVTVKDEYLYKGSFPLISPEYKDPLKFIGVSCNNNKKLSDKNNYSYNRIANTNLWSNIVDTSNVDIIFHTGSQIYGDYIVENNIGFTNMRKSCNTDHIYQTYANLYRTAYGEHYQGEAMRNSLNVMILGSHDIFKNFESTKGDLLLKSYYISGMNAFLNYQYLLHTDLEDISYIFNSNRPIYYSLQYGKYSIFGLDLKNEVYHDPDNDLFSDTQLYWLFYNLTQTRNRSIILLSPTPIGNLNKTNSYIKSLLSKYGKEELLHPDNYDRTVMFLENLNGFKNSKDMILISGCDSKTFINSVYRTDYFDALSDSTMWKPVIRQLVTGPITRNPKCNINKVSRMCDWIQQKYDVFENSANNISISSKTMVSTNNSYGVIEKDLLYNVCVDSEDSGGGSFCNILCPRGGINKT